jgi:hypothetical protein
LVWDLSWQRQKTRLSQEPSTWLSHALAMWGPCARTVRT